MADQPAGRLAPVPGAENVIPWPTPLPLGCAALSFYGEGDQTTAEFVLASDGALRIAAEKGPFQLRVGRPDGSFLDDVANLPDGGLALMAIPEGGTYALVVQSPARWAVTVVSAAAAPDGGGASPAPAKRKWWQFWK